MLNKAGVRNLTGTGLYLLPFSLCLPTLSAAMANAQEALKAREAEGAAQRGEERATAPRTDTQGNRVALRVLTARP